LPFMLLFRMFLIARRASACHGLSGECFGCRLIPTKIPVENLVIGNW